MLLPWDITIGALYSYRTQLPWSATAGRDLNLDSFNTDLVPGTTRNSGSRDLNLTAVNAYRTLNGLAVISEADIDSSRISIMDLRVEQGASASASASWSLLAQAFNLLNTTNLQAQFGSGRVGNALSNTFGRITSARPSRQVELAIKRCGRWTAGRGRMQVLHGSRLAGLGARGSGISFSTVGMAIVMAAMFGRDTGSTAANGGARDSNSGDATTAADSCALDLTEHRIDRRVLPPDGRRPAAVTGRLAGCFHRPVRRSHRRSIHAYLDGRPRRE